MAEALKQAQDHLDAEDDEKALQAAEAAVSEFREAKNIDSLADALLLSACAHIAQGSRKAANKVAQDELASFTTAGHKPGQARMLLAIGEANSQHRGRENKEKALEAANKAQAMFSTLGDNRMEAKANIVIANIQIAKGNAADAVKVANAAKALSQSAGDKRGQGVAEHCLAVAFSKGDCESGLCARAAQAAIVCFQEAGLKQMEAFERICLAKWTMELEGKPAKALQLALKAQAFCRACGHQEHKALGMAVECYLVLAKKDSSAVGSTVMSAKAVRASQEGIDHFHATGNKVGEAHARESLTMAQISQEAEDAAQSAQAAAEAFREVGDHEREVQMLQYASSLFCKMGRPQEAASAAEEMLKKADGPDSKVAALEAAFAAYMQTKEFTKAKDTAKKIVDILRQAKNRQKEGLARLMLCQAHYKSQDFSAGVSVGSEAQAMLHNAKDFVGEAKALRTVAKIHFFAQEYELAQRAAIRARELVRDLGDPQAEGDSALLLSNIRLQMLLSLDDRTSNEVFTNNFFEMRDAAKEAKWIGETYGNRRLVACALKLMAEAYTLVAEIPDALKFAEEAKRLFILVDDEPNLAQLLLVEAETWFAGGQQRNANQSCKQALKLFQELGDEAGKAKAEDTMERINPPTPPPEPSWEVEDAKIPEYKVAKPQRQVEVEVAPIGKAFQKKQLGKLNLNKIDEDLLTATLYNVVQEVVGYDMDFLEDDLPLMQAGIASRQAVTLRAALEDELKGISFPATIVFDFPTIANIKEYVIDQA